MMVADSPIVTGAAVIAKRLTRTHKPSAGCIAPGNCRVPSSSRKRPTARSKSHELTSRRSSEGKANGAIVAEGGECSALRSAAR